MNCHFNRIDSLAAASAACRHRRSEAIIMRTHIRSLTVALFALSLASPVLAQGPLLPPGDKEPVLRTEPGGPTSLVTALSFSGDGKRLYAAGFDKVVRVWVAGNDGKFALDKAAYRVPIGPGIDGTINAVALSPDEKWLAVAGQGIVRGAADFRVPGLILSKTGGFNKSMWEDQGLIYVFSTQDQSVRLLRGHMGPVFALTWAYSADGKSTTLVSAGRDRDMVNSKYRGAVRVWDAAKGGEPLATRLDLPETLIRPGLAAWHTGKKAEDVRVAIAWNDGLLHLWDAATDKMSEARDGFNGTANGRLNITAVYLPKEGHLLTTVLRLYADEDTPAAAQLRRWDVSGAKPVSVKAKSFAADEGLEPVAMTLVSSKPGQAPDYAAIAVRKRTREEDNIRLVLADISVEQLGTIAVSRQLWPTRGKLPVLAAVSGGRFLAAGGNPYHSIRAYSVADLLANGEKAEPQAFKGVGKTWGFVAFVRKGKDRGLLLNNTVLQPNRGKRPVSPDEGNVIFNLNQRVFTDAMEGWKIDAPGLDGWGIEGNARERDKLGKTTAPAGATVTTPDGKVVRIRIPGSEDVTDYAFLPAMPPLNVPLVAIASHELDQPMLRLYNARTGEQVRQYTGHHYKISSIAFSADGRYLASVADDQTVCVFSLDKLEKWVLGVLGNLPETAFRDQIVVKSVAADGPAAGQLVAYDIIEGMVDDENKLHRYSALRGLYNRLAQAKPGSKVNLQVKNEKGETRKVEVTVGSAMVERNRALLTAVGVQNPLGVAGITEASTFYSPLPGLVLQYAPTVVLTPAKSNLTKGEMIEGIDQNKKVRPMASARDLYEAIALTKPGTTLQLRIRGKGNVGALVGQGSDERKPLFTIFTTGAGAPATWDWVGWSPIGPFETSGRRAERYVGWHFNTGDPDAPATFALIDQYRKEYYRDGILNFLVNRGDLAPALKDWSDQRKGEALPRPKMTMYADEVGPDPDKRNGLGQVIVRQLPVTVKLAIDDFPPDMLDTIQWQVDGGPLENFPVGVSARERGVDLALPRGLHRVRAVVKTKEASPQVYMKDLVVKVLPPAPVVQPLAAPRQVNAAVLPWASKVQQGRADQAVRVRLAQMHGGKEIHSRIWDIKAGDAEQTLDVSDKLELKPGDNEIELVAFNTDAAKDEVGLETDRRRWTITYVPPEVKIGPARITLSRVATGTLKEPEVQSVEPGKPLVVRSEVVRIYGTIECDEPLSEATWVSNGGKPTALSGFATEKKIDFVQLLKVKPGDQTLAFAAKSPKSEATRVELKLNYHPALPRLVLRTDDRPLYADDAGAAPKVNVAGTYLSESPIPFEATLLLNDKEIGAAPTEVDWTRVITLDGKPIPMENRIQVRLKNAYETHTTEPVTVRYLRPPTDIHFEGAAPPKEMHSKNLLVDLTARVKSHLPLVRESLEVEVNGREVPSAEFLPRDGDNWGIRVRNLPLEPNKKNVVKLWVSNPEARCRQAGEVVVVYDPPVEVKKPPTPAEVSIVEPAQNANVLEPDVQVRFRVKSETPLKRVEIVRETQNDKEERIPLNVADLKPNDQGIIDVRQAVKVTPGVNRLRVVAVNDGGEQESATVVNLPAMPVRLVIDEIRPEGGGAPIKPKVLPEGRLVFTEVPKGQVQIRGRVLWSKEDDENLKKISMVKMYVNGFQQLPAALRSPTGNGREREFTARVVLNRSQGNDIEIELPDLKQDHGNRHSRQFTLDCANPVPGQRLHLLVVGIGESNPKALVDEALGAVNAKADKEGILRSPAFSQVRVYGPLTRFVKPEDVYTQVNLIKKTIELLASKGTPNDVVMVYYKGDEHVQQQGNYFATTVTKFDKDLKRSGITFKGIQDCFDETLGAKVLMLDVARASDGNRSKDEVVQAKDTNTYFSVLRYQWGKDSSTRREGELMKDWRSALSSAKVEVLKAAASQIASMFEQRSGADQAAFDRHIPTGLADLMVSKKSSP
jgi:WD40 repeat protein